MSKKFRIKKFSIKDGHYTGPKDLDKVPGVVEIIGKSTIAGSVLGGTVGKIANNETVRGAIEGGKWGFLGGVLAKMFLNYLHNPMKKVKYSEVDRNIRRAFGVYRVSGVTVGDGIDNRASIDERFGFNDRNVTNYKINFVIAENSIAMYTFGVDEQELGKIDHVLDYYCKMYYGMSYISNLINSKMNAYAVVITFTNYQVISNFIMELSNDLKTKINLLDNNAIINNRLTENSNEGGNKEKNFSYFDTTQVSSVNKFDLAKILGKSCVYALPELGKGLKVSFSSTITFALIGLLNSAMEKMRNDELTKMGAPAPRENFGNPYLQDTLDKLHYVNGFNYTVKDPKAEDNMSMMNGRFIITTLKGSDDTKTIDNVFWNGLKGKVNRTEVANGKVILYSYTIQSRNEFEFILKKLMSTKITFNIYEK